MLQTNRNPHVTLEMPRQQVEDAAYWCRAKWFVALVMAGLLGFFFIPLVKPFDVWSEWLKPFWRTPSVHVLTSTEIQKRVDENNPIVKAVAR